MARHIDKLTVDKIMSATNIVDVIGDFLTLRKRGIEYVCLCPFHDDQTLGNFSINPNKGLYKCFACGAGGDAIKFLMEYKESRLTYPDALRYLAKKYSISIPEDDDDQQRRWEHVKPAQPKAIQIIERQPILLHRDWVKYTTQMRDTVNFVRWFRSLGWKGDQCNRANQVLWEYCVGGWTDGRVAFWQIDETGQPHSAKLMRYQDNGKRSHDENPGWLHNQKGLREYFPQEQFSHHSCLFGLHLINRYPSAYIHIVESEKTALIMAASKGDHEHNLWLACGGLQFFKPEMVDPLVAQHRRIFLWPDKDGVEAWEMKQRLMPDTANVEIYTGFINRYWIEEDGPKADVADITLRLMERPDTFKVKQQGTTDPNATAVSDHGATLPPPPEGVSEAEWLEHLAILKQISDYDIIHPQDEPILDPEELRDPRLHQVREVLRQKFNFNKTKTNGKTKE